MGRVSVDSEVCLVEAEGEAEDLQQVARLTDLAFYASEPHEVYARLRREAPVFWYEAGEIWGVSKIDDARFVLGHPELFSSMYGVACSQAMPVDDGSACPASGMPRRAELRRQAMLRRVGEGNELILMSDPPRHSRLRRLVSSAFTPRFVAKLEDGIRTLAREAIETIQPGEVTDLIDVVARPIPLLAIAEMLGLPREDWQTFGRWSDAIADLSSQQGGGGSDDPSDGMEVLLEVATYFGAQLVEREEHPRDDVLSALHNKVDGEALSFLDQLGFCLVLLVAGNETTQILISGGTKLLAQHPDQRLILVEDPSKISSGVEEMLRYVTPVPSFCRTAIEKTEIRGCQIEKGDFVVVMHAAANRDEDVWEDHDTFAVTRKPDPGIAFGFGPHFCLGASLARLEARVVFEELLKRYPNFELAGPAFRVPSSEVPRYEAMPIVFHQA